MVAYWPARSSSRSDVRRRVSAPSAHSYPTPGEPTMLVHDVLQRAAVAAAIGVFSAAPAAAQSTTAITAENVMHFEVLVKPGRNAMGSYGQYDRAGNTNNWTWKTP